MQQLKAMNHYGKIRMTLIYLCEENESGYIVYVKGEPIQLTHQEFVKTFSN